MQELWSDEPAAETTLSTCSTDIGLLEDVESEDEGDLDWIGEAGVVSSAGSYHNSCISLLSSDVYIFTGYLM